ncbi:MAG: hypothetical protein ABSF95_08095 [Verrucomicrobiota bacterium]|jgi:hypothetical protein
MSKPYPKSLLLAALVFLFASRAGANQALENEAIRADFNQGGLAAITDKASGSSIVLAQDSFAVFAGNESVEGDFLAPALEPPTATKRTYRFESAPWTVWVVYELEPGWKFVSKQILLAHAGQRDLRVQRLELLRGRVQTPIAAHQPIRDGALLRLAESAGGQPTHGLFLQLQNPFLQLKRQAQRLSLAYPPDLPWNPTNGVFRSDRLLLGPYQFSGLRFPARLLPEWKWAPATDRPAEAWLDRAEVDALVECVRAFLLWRPAHPVRLHVAWCENDYQIDIATPEGRAEYRRIIDQAAAIGCRFLLFTPANSAVSSLAENRDAWGWENLLWLTLGQKLRQGLWDPAKDKLPASVQELADYAKGKDIKFLAYVYPSLPFLQNPDWTRWVPNGQPGGYLGADTGLRSFQDWLLDKLVAFHDTTGAGGFAFDHWWIAYDQTTTSRYAQWAGCRRILEELRRRRPDCIIDGRQQYHHFGAWTWLAGTYPHPLNSDEQPESFRAFPDLHWSRVSADRQRRTAYWYRTECFVPPEIMPGYMTHQTPRNDSQGQTIRTTFRTADWDLLGWKYSVISSIATAPFNLLVNFIPARDQREFQAFSPADRKWFRDWFDWTDQNAETLGRVQPILGAPQLGRVDGTAAFKDGHGFIFLFNPNYRQLPVAFSLDRSIGLATGDRFLLRQLYPDAERGRLWAPAGKPFWGLGDQAALELPGTEALVLEISPAPARLDQPLLLGACGQASLAGAKLDLSGVLAEPGAQRDVAVVLPEGRKLNALAVNGVNVQFRQTGSLVSCQLRFAGSPLAPRQQIGSFDPQFTGGRYQAQAVLPARAFKQLEARRRTWPVHYTDQERLAPWLNSDRLLLFINVAEPDDEKMIGVTLKVDGKPLPVKPAYSAIVRNNPQNTFLGWYADLSSLQPEVKHLFEVQLPKLDPGQFQGLFLDTLEAESTPEIVP